MPTLNALQNIEIPMIFANVSVAERPANCQNLRVYRKLAEQVRQIPGVNGAAPQQLLRGAPTYQHYQNLEGTVVVVGVVAGIFTTLGYPLARGEMTLSVNQAVIGPKVCEYMVDLRKRESVTPHPDLKGE